MALSHRCVRYGELLGWQMRGDASSRSLTGVTRSARSTDCGKTSVEVRKRYTIGWLLGRTLWRHRVECILLSDSPPDLPHHSSTTLTVQIHTQTRASVKSAQRVAKIPRAYSPARQSPRVPRIRGNTIASQRNRVRVTHGKSYCNCSYLMQKRNLKRRKRFVEPARQGTCET